jgi:hypothetical protein
MAITRMSNLGIASLGSEKYNDMLAGNPPFLPSSFDSIATALGTGSNSTITFSSIPATYKYLQIRTLSKDQAGGNASSDLRLQFNGDTSAIYDNQWVYGNGGYPSAVTTQVSNGDSYASINRANQGSAAATDYYGVSIIDIVDYASTVKNKTVRSRSGCEDTNTVFSTTSMTSSTWRSTAAISSITIINGFGNNWTNKSVFALYGIKG